jgi:hypothetical protein
MTEPMLWTPPIDCITVGARFDRLTGWYAVVQHRHHGLPWSACQGDHYDVVSSSELVDIVGSSFGELLLPEGRLDHVSYLR